MPKKKGSRKPDHSEGGDPIPLHQRAMEKEIQEIGKQLRGKEFESMEEARAALEEAISFNRFVPGYLLGRRGMPGALPALVGFGDESEAAVYFAEALPGWLRTPGAIEWLRANAP